ncbi:protein NRT1/ PTR FAMILY 2.11-like isoform X3 [Andrographis paniculata]|uniref:protein NRT1/ PTR FAMILY 2.11-like isoform X3 n=1 Tax=Andrographis paniculata TaxID=175694 RepID=UPI0021E8F65B|nr:protein NRT1/ PTR FAMILY 2.11-like isoform X3 [Andrographis paniculata]
MEAKEETAMESEADEPEINYRGIKAMPYIIGNETFEKLGAIGTLFNLQVYLTTVFNMKRISATTLLNVFHGTTNFATLIGAYLCDTYFGRYNTLGFGSVASFLVLVVAARKRRLKSPAQPWLSLYNYTPAKSINSKLPYTNQFRFLDKAAILTAADRRNPDGSPSNPWRLCSLQQVEQLKCVVRVIPIWAAAVLYHVGEKQQYLVFQAMQSDRHLAATFQIPPATYSIFSMTTLVLFLPLYDRLLVPALRRLTRLDGGITVLQRIGAGIFLTVIESLVAALVERRRRRLALDRTADIVISGSRGAASPMSAMWLVPQLVLAGLAEAFAAIGQVEFFYKQFPESMRSFAGSFFFCAMAAASYLNGLLISVVHRATAESPAGNWLPEDLNKGRLDMFYYMVAGICGLNFAYFLVCAKWYRYKRVELEMELELEGKEIRKF